MWGETSMVTSLPGLLLKVWSQFYFLSHLMVKTQDHAVVIMDNAYIHHVEQVATLIQNTGAILHHTALIIIHWKNPLQK